MAGFSDWLDRFLKRLCTVQLGLAALILASMVLLNAYEISMRYLAGKSFLGAQEVTILMFTWCAFLGFTAIASDGSDIVVALIRDRFPEGVRRTVITITNAASAAFGAILAYLSGRLMSHQAGQYSAIVGFSMSLYTLPVLVCAGTIALIYLSRTIKCFVDRPGGKSRLGGDH